MARRKVTTAPVLASWAETDKALRDIREGEELFYDYGLVIDEKLTKTLKRQYLCLCGAETCRGTMLAVPAKDKKEKKDEKGGKDKKKKKKKKGKKDAA